MSINQIKGKQIKADTAGDGLVQDAQGNTDVFIDSAKGLEIINDKLGIKLDGTSLSFTANGLKTSEDNKTCIIARRTTSQTISNNSMTRVQLNSEDIDLLNEFNTSTYKFTATKAGVYLVTVWCDMDNGSIPVGGRELHIYVNGSSYKLISQAANYNVNFRGEMTALLKLNIGDYVEEYIYQSSGVNMTLNKASMEIVGLILI